MTILETYTRVFVDGSDLDKTIAFYESILDGKQSMRFSYVDHGLEIAAVSSPKLSVLIIAGPPENRAMFAQTRVTIRVEQVKNYVKILEKNGAQQLEDVQRTPVGHKTRFRHPDGLIAEYVDWLAEE